MGFCGGPCGDYIKFIEFIVIPDKLNNLDKLAPAEVGSGVRYCGHRLAIVVGLPVYLLVWTIPPWRSSRAACAAASLAVSRRKGEQDT
jgi:hypothetical protein